MAKDYITIKDLGMKIEYVRLDRVLEIIDTIEVSDKRGDAFDKGFETAVVFIRWAVMDLKGDEHEISN